MCTCAQTAAARGTIYELSKLTDERLQEAIEADDISPNMERKDAEALRERPHRSSLPTTNQVTRGGDFTVTRGSDPNLITVAARVTPPTGPETVTVLANVTPPTGPDRVTVFVRPPAAPQAHCGHHLEGHPVTRAGTLPFQRGETETIVFDNGRPINFTNLIGQETTRLREIVRAADGSTPEVRREIIAALKQHAAATRELIATLRQVEN